MKIIIIGSGVAGLTAGYRLCKSNEIIIFEKDAEIGGWLQVTARTVQEKVIL